MILTQNARVPIGTVQSFPTTTAVSSFFGAASNEAALAAVYFGGFTNSTKKPGALLFAQYPAAAVSAYLQGGNISAVPLATVESFSGSLNVVMDGYTYAIPSLNLAGATSFSAIAALIQQGIAQNDPQECAFTGSISGNVLTVSSVSSGTISVGQTIVGNGDAAGTIITALGSGTGLAGTYTVNTAQTVASESMTAVATAPKVSFDSVSGGLVITSGITGAASGAAFATGSLAAPLLLTQATGAVLSQGSAAVTPSAFMTSVASITQNWATFMTAFDPDGGQGNAQKLAFAAWTNAQQNRYAYVAFDTDITPTASFQATQSLGYLIKQNNYSGTCPIYQPSNIYGAAFICGFVASINFQQTNGRATLAYKGQTGLVAGVSNEAIADNLEANGYNYIGAVATANQGFVYCYPGSVSGPFEWMDSFVNQIWLNNALQLAIMELFTNVNSIPYNAAGYALIEAACLDAINAGLNFGAFRAGVTLSEAQIAEVNNFASGIDIATTLSARGWYLLIQDASPQVRQARQSPPAYFFYVDGESVQSIVLDSYDVQ